MSEANAKPRRRWCQFSLRALLILVTLAAGLFAIVAAGIAEFRTWTPHQLVGPTSPNGLNVIIRVDDCAPMHIGSDFYADVDIVDSNGHVVFQWDDPTGQDSYGAVKDLVSSMKWRSVSTLTFGSTSGAVEIRRDDSKKWIANSPL